jgi:hypothetical protein
MSSLAARLFWCRGLGRYQTVEMTDYTEGAWVRVAIRRALLEEVSGRKGS